MTTTMMTTANDIIINEDRTENDKLIKLLYFFNSSFYKSLYITFRINSCWSIVVMFLSIYGIFLLGDLFKQRTIK